MRTVQCWGQNDFGQIGAQGCRYSATPVTVSGIANAVSIATGFLHTCALLADGTVRCWGHNDFGQLGDGTTTSSATPVTVQGIVNPLAICARHRTHVRADARRVGPLLGRERSSANSATAPRRNSLAPVQMHATGMTWTSSRPDIATVSAAGVVTGVGRGTATIAVSDAFGNSGSTTVTVRQTADAGAAAAGRRHRAA